MDRIHKAQPRHIDNPEWLVHLAGPFPVKARVLKDLAAAWSFDGHMRHMLDRFYDDDMFDSGDDFLTRYEELELLTSEEAQLPHEILRSPQG